MRFRDNGEDEMWIVCSETETEYQLLMMETQISRKSEMFRAAFSPPRSLEVSSVPTAVVTRWEINQNVVIRWEQIYFHQTELTQSIIFQLKRAAGRQNSFLLLHCRVSRAVCQVYCPVRCEQCDWNCINNVRWVEKTLRYPDSFVGEEQHNGDQLVVFASHFSSCSASARHYQAR